MNMCDEPVHEQLTEHADGSLMNMCDEPVHEQLTEHAIFFSNWIPMHSVIKGHV
jgi:hypothetical protein